jgi:hypothetical protein
MYRAPQEFGIIALEKEMLNGFWAVTEAATFITFQLRLAKLSLVKITPLFKYHKNTFILEGTLICHKSCDTLTPLFINAAYIDLTEKVPNASNFQTKLSLSPL